MKIAEREIANGLKPYIIAEVSCNHKGDLTTALDMIEVARWAGADAVKFQAYTPDTITLDCHKPDFIIQDGLWKGRTLYDLYKETYTPFEWFPKIFKQAKKIGIPVFASVFDRSSVDMLDGLGCPAFKIASMELTDTPLISYAARKGKPLIISTGMGNSQDIREAVAASRPDQVALLHCTSEYPQTVEYSTLCDINLLKVDYPTIPIGISDHTPGNVVVPVAATGLGAAIIEKHLKTEDKSGSEDDEFSLSPEAFKSMVHLVSTTYEALQPREFITNPSRQLRRSLYAVEDIKRGETFTETNLRSIRPGFGLAPKHLPRLLGRKADKDYRKGDRIT
jgi:pseudaminic acid synthase